tara:strand:+ start:1361 stop:1543 length:183 start_codon:yes stop_codon:yes gene_type:complete
MDYWLFLVAFFFIIGAIGVMGSGEQVKATPDEIKANKWFVFFIILFTIYMLIDSYIFHNS